LGLSKNKQKKAFAKATMVTPASATMAMPAKTKMATPPKLAKTKNVLAKTTKRC